MQQPSKPALEKGEIPSIVMCSEMECIVALEWYHYLYDKDLAYFDSGEAQRNASTISFTKAMYDLNIVHHLSVLEALGKRAGGNTVLVRPLSVLAEEALRLDPENEVLKASVSINHWRESKMEEQGELDYVSQSTGTHQVEDDDVCDCVLRGTPCSAHVEEATRPAKKVEI